MLSVIYSSHSTQRRLDGHTAKIIVIDATALRPPRLALTNATLPSSDSSVPAPLSTTASSCGFVRLRVHCVVAATARSHSAALPAPKAGPGSQCVLTMLLLPSPPARSTHNKRDFPRYAHHWRAGCGLGGHGCWALGPLTQSGGIGMVTVPPAYYPPHNKSVTDMPTPPRRRAAVAASERM